VHALATSHGNLWASVGVHPDNEGVREPSVDELVELSRRPRVVAIGETGLDYYRLGDRTVADMEWQRDRFRTHIRAGRRQDLPLVIHTRSASDDTLAILREEGGFNTPAGKRCPCRAASSIASPSPWTWRGRRWTWASIFRFRAS